MLKKFTRIAQMPGMPPMPGGGGPPMPGMPPAGAPPMPPMPAMPMSAPAGPPPRKEIYGPLDTLAKILYDANITDMIENSFGTAPEDLALNIWEEYGGDEKGGIGHGNVGQRNSSDINTQTEEGTKDRDATDDTKWARLPKDKTIEDITSLEDLTNIMNGLVMGAVKKSAGGGGGGAPGGGPPGGGGPPPGGPPPGGGEGPGGPPGGGMPPGLASARARLVLASALDRDGLFHLADETERTVLCAGSVTDQIKKKCRDFPPSPGYGICLWNPKTKTAYWVSGDGDSEEDVQHIMSELRSIPGVKNVEAEAETFPRGDGWQRIN